MFALSLSLSLSLSHFRAFSRIYARVRVIRARCDRDNLLPVRQDRHRANLTATSVHCYAIGVSDSITQDAFLSHFPSAVSSSYFFRRCHLCDLHSSETPPPLPPPRPENRSGFVPGRKRATRVVPRWSSVNTRLPTAIAARSPDSSGRVPSSSTIRRDRAALAHSLPTSRRKKK